MIPQMRRVIRRSSLTSNAEVGELLRMVLISEIVEPSPCLWLVSPWISDVPIIDNTTLAFAYLGPNWGARRVRLSEVLLARLQASAGVVVATRTKDSRNVGFLEELERAVRTTAIAPDLLRIVEDELLHEKGVASARFYLSGSLNITWNGIHVLGEKAEVSTVPVDVQSAVRSFADRYGTAGRQTG